MRSLTLLFEMKVYKALELPKHHCTILMFSQNMLIEITVLQTVIE